MAQNNGNYLNETLPNSISEEEKSHYFKLAKTGDENARQKLIEHNLRLVAYIIKLYFHTVSSENICLSTEDLMGIGTIGLIKAIDNFDLEKGYKFATFAKTTISNEILMGLRKNKRFKANISLNEQLNIDIKHIGNIEDFDDIEINK